MLLVALALSNCAQNPVSGQPNLVLVSETQEIAIGRREDPKVRKEYGVYDNAPLQQYVNEVGQRLAKASHRPGLEYHFLVVDSPDVNAFALPGGYLYIARGLLAYLNSEAELAAVLGHELGHVTARHSVQQLTAATAANIGAAILQIFVPETRGGLGDTAINVLGGALLSGYGREHELEADRLGAEYLARTGYDPQATVKVVGVLKNQELFDAEVAKAEGRQPRAYHGLFATHPDNDTRLQQVVGEAARFKQASTRTAREEFLRRIDRMVFADSASQGIVRDNHLYHAQLGLAMRFPAGWRVRNRPQNVTATSPKGEALIDLRSGGPAQGSPADVLRKRVNLSFGAQVTPTTVNGLPAAMTTTTIGGAPTRVVCVFLGKSAYLIGAQARTAAAFNQHQGEINASLMSFHAITSEERALARPLRLRVITAQPGLTFAQLAQRSPLGRFAEGHLRVINGLYPAGEPVAGQPLKIVE
ncbi:MAG: M48 family metalloprotease [Betaproteobacteria bacterium]|nr:M48 family metalloprotease [Betaproteobacteria bacterium]MBI3938861.1 M48 family metalloprotease [Betaproteobacteria bacterium]